MWALWGSLVRASGKGGDWNEGALGLWHSSLQRVTADTHVFTSAHQLFIPGIGFSETSCVLGAGTHPQEAPRPGAWVWAASQRRGLGQRKQLCQAQEMFTHRSCGRTVGLCKSLKSVPVGQGRATVIR